MVTLFLSYIRFVDIYMRLPVFIFLVFLSFGISAQEKEKPEEDQRFSIDTPATLEFQLDEKEEEPKKKKKVKKRVFYGLKTKKGFTRKGYGERVTYELFHYLKKPTTPQTFVRDIYWYDFTRKEIRKTTTFDPSKGVLLHGPYEKRQGEIVLQKGIFYKGTKHGRWLTYNRDSVLTDKEKYYRGWPRESEVSYYDPHERKKMKEIVPIEFGEKEGYYYRFYENGQVAVVGEYHWDRPVGDWTEYYPNNKRKKILTYPKEPFEEESKPFVKAEWNDKGKEIYRNNKMED
jgi:antitoxin component YwqK of YwqJK toxin-antitoxin module